MAAEFQETLNTASKLYIVDTQTLLPDMLVDTLLDDHPNVKKVGVEYNPFVHTPEVISDIDSFFWSEAVALLNQRGAEVVPLTDMASYGKLVRCCEQIASGRDYKELYGHRVTADYLTYFAHPCEIIEKAQERKDLDLVMFDLDRTRLMPRTFNFERDDIYWYKHSRDTSRTAIASAAFNGVVADPRLRKIIHAYNAFKNKQIVLLEEREENKLKQLFVGTYYPDNPISHPAEGLFELYEWDDGKVLSVETLGMTTFKDVTMTDNIFIGTKLNTHDGKVTNEILYVARSNGDGVFRGTWNRSGTVGNFIMQAGEHLDAVDWEREI